MVGDFSMTRDEFITNVNTWGELISISIENACGITDDVFSDDSKNEHITNELMRMVESCNSWLDVKEKLNDIPTGYEFYRYDDTWGDFYPLEDDDFEEYKADVYNFMDRMFLFDEVEEDDECVEVEHHVEEQIVSDCEDEYESDDDEMSIIGLYEACNNKLQTIRSTGFVTRDKVVINGNPYYYEAYEGIPF